MGYPTITGAWDFSKINVVEPFTTLNDQSATLLFTWHRYLVDTIGWTVKYTCDGTTGPTSAADHTDRLTTKATCTTRGASATAAQSFSVLTNPDGVDVLFAYQGSSTDDEMLFKVSFDGLYVPAAISNQQPTATDEANIHSNAITMVGAGVAQRVFQIVATTDKKNFRVWVFSSSSCQRHIYFENLGTSSVNSAFSWTKQYVAGDCVTTSFANAGNQSGAPMAPSAAGTGAPSGSSGGGAKIGGLLVAVGGGGERYLGGTVSVFTNAAPELQGAAPITVLCYASNTNARGGKLGNAKDSWQAFAAGQLDGDTYNSLGFAYLNARMVPWDGVHTVQTA